MFSIQRLGALLLLASSVLSHPVNEPRQAGSIVVTGARNGGGGGVQPRLEVHELQKNADQWNIYLLALESFKAMDANDAMSYYAIAGIHGRPFSEYNGAKRCEGCVETGYCTHASTLFPTWHRAYVALFEQSLQNNAVTVAWSFKEGKDRDRYLKAATTLRAPYWDWALDAPAGEGAFPSMFTDETVTVTTPTGEKTIPNPLLRFTYVDGQISIRNVTIEPSVQRQLRSNLWTLLTSQDSYNAFSTQAAQAQNSNHASLEAIHDTVHVNVGGEMANPELAGFDPVFWLHHAMVDRAMTLYQDSHPKAWLASSTIGVGTYALAAGSTKDSKTVLAPFGITSDKARDTKSFNYNYADLASGQSPAEIINGLYGNRPAAQTKRSTEDSSEMHEYTANIQVDLPGSEGSFNVFIFDGEVDNAEPSTWYTDADFIGVHGFFTNNDAQGNGEDLATAAVSLTPALERRVASGKLADMKPKTVAEYFERNKVYWRVVERVLDHYDQEIELSQIPQLDVTLATAKLTVPEDSSLLPTWGEFVPLDQAKSD